MSRYVKYVLLIMCATNIPSYVNAHNFDNTLCNAVVQKQNIDFKQVNIDKWDQLHKSSCEDNELKDSQDIVGGLDLVYKAIPINFDFGISNKEESVRRFCSEYDHLRSEIVKTTNFNLELSKDQLDAFVQCVSLTTDTYGAKIFPTIQPDEVSIRISRGINNVKFESISHPGNMICTSVSDTGESIPANDLSGKILSSAADMTITCLRSKITSNGIVYYEGGTVTVNTDHGDLSIPVLREAKYEPALVSKVKTIINNLELNNSNLLIENNELKNRTVLVCSQLDRCGGLIAGDVFKDASGFLANAIASKINAIGAEKDKNGGKVCESIGMKFASAIARKETVNCGGTFDLKSFDNTKWKYTFHRCGTSIEMLDKVYCRY